MITDENKSALMVWFHLTKSKLITKRKYMEYCKRKTSVIAAWGVIYLIFFLRQILQVHAIAYALWCNPHIM